MKTYKYGTHNRHELDLYEASSNDLLIVGLHGGSWIQGDKSSLANYGLNFSKNGISFASINYRLSPLFSFEDMIRDINDAIYFLSKTIRFKKLALFGISAGAHLALLCSYANRLDAKCEFVISEVGPTDFLDRTFIHNIIYSTAQFHLITNLTKSTMTFSEYMKGKIDPLWKKYSPITYVNQHTVPSFLAYAKKDQLVPYQNGLTLKKLLEKNNIAHEMITFEHASHFLEPYLDPETRVLYEKSIITFAKEHF